MHRRDGRALASIDLWIRIGLAAAAVAPFAATLFYGYVYDDTAIVLTNPVLAGWKSLAEVWKHPYWSTGGADTAGLYRPLLMACFAILWNGAHRFAIAFHLFAVSAHVIATLLVWSVTRRAVGRWAAAGGALWFALLPVHVEAVANISNVSEVLVSIWTLLLALVLLPPSSRDTAPAEPPGWGRAAIAALIYAAALFSKESGAVAPALAIVVAFAWRRPAESSPMRDAFARLREWWRVIALWIVALAAVVIVRRIVLGGITGTVSMAVPGLAGLSARQRVTAVLSLGERIVQLVVWPTIQSPDYGPSALPSGFDRQLAAMVTLASLVVIAGVCARLAWRSRNSDGRPLAAVTWCLVGLLPASNLLSASSAILAERTLYVSSVGVAMLVAWCIERLAELAVARRRFAVTWRARLASVAIAAAVTVVCARGYLRTRDYARVWRDQPSLFKQIVRADSLDYRGYQLLAVDAKNHRRTGESAALFARAYALLPGDETLLTDYGEYLLEMHRDRYALAIGQRLLEHQDMWTYPRAVTQLLNATARVWGPDSVLASARRLNARAPSARAALFIGMVFDARGDSSAAQAAYRGGLRAAPGDSALLAHVAKVDR
ncbi:MAG: tetratricopeptide repeat protein [Gemmatimonadaceae bacterium]